MKIYLQTTHETQVYLPLLLRALEASGHEVLYNDLVRNDSSGRQVCDLCLELSVGGLQSKKAQQMSSVAVMPSKAESRMRKIVLVLGNSTLPRRAIVDGLHLRQNSRAIFVNNYLKPAIAKGYVEMTCPAHPNLPEQTYRLTSKGLAFHKEITTSLV